MTKTPGIAQDIPRVLFIKDVMALCEISRDFVMKEINSGELTAYRFGSNKNKYRIYRKDYLEWLESHRV